MNVNRADPLPWHAAAWRLLDSYRALQRLPQALLLIGPHGVGKRILAEQFTARLFCARRDAAQPCGSCRDCHWLTAGTHPDFIKIAPEDTDKAITIAQIRQLLQDLALKPHTEHERVVLIAPAERMNLAAANAFLKCLEEPPERTVFLLLSVTPSLLPATVRSRCQRLVLPCPPCDVAKHWLQGHGVARPEIALALAHGAPLQALQCAEMDWAAKRQSVFKAWQRAAERQIVLPVLAEEWSKLPEEQLLDWLIAWTADVIKCALQQTERLTHRDLHQELAALAHGVEPPALFAFYDQLLWGWQQRHSALNKQLFFEEVLMHWAYLHATA